MLPGVAEIHHASLFVVFRGFGDAQANLDQSKKIINNMAWGDTWAMAQGGGAGVMTANHGAVITALVARRMTSLRLHGCSSARSLCEDHFAKVFAKVDTNAINTAYEYIYIYLYTYIYVYMIAGFGFSALPPAPAMDGSPRGLRVLGPRPLPWVGCRISACAG